MGFYHTAQICLNGHVVTNSFDKNVARRQDFCDKCGSKTIVNCTNCNATIHGNYQVEGVWNLQSTESTSPAYCYNCGNPYPWTETALESAKILINEDENLNSDEKLLFCKTLPELIVESPTPKTQVAIVRFKKLLSKTASYTADGLRDIFIDVASETIKKSLGL
ncbi:DUF2321 domain-containing protein [Clostridium lacusfryxellense]|uniref:DUF2321 domain-containing protein n=1 Tax=Clostridium lacusfryxellense TaxID=205328 RepID=UPI001C0C028B|nr:DUF2321 domain-containing protein [Clostridium lacusfryxellense]MBU3111772.1 DUF2321 domain-containing protein [Clostridium lacusfryxellense]